MNYVIPHLMRDPLKIPD